MKPQSADSVARSKAMLLAVSAVFAVLGVSLLGLTSLYRARVLEPRLRSQAIVHAEMLARSQTRLIAGALRSGTGAERARAVRAALDEILLLRDPSSGTPYFRGVELEVDYDVVAAESGSLNLRHGDVLAEDGFPAEVAVYDPRSDELIGVARFRVSDAFFTQLSRDVREQLGNVSLAVLVLLAALWGVLVVLLQNLERQRLGRHQAEEELSVQERRYQQLLNSLSGYFVYRRDVGGRLTFVSDAARRLFGRLPAELVQPGEGLASPDEPGGGRTFEVELADARGNRHHVEVSEVAVSAESGAVVAFEGIGRDVTAERLAREELRHARDQAEAANRAKSRFLANVSHEIRTPLNAIVGLTALLLKDVASPKQRGSLEKVRGAARALLEIVEDILDLARIEAGRLELRSEELDLDALLAEVADVASLEAAAKRIELLLHVAAGIPRRLRGDGPRLKQVLLNLASNAVKFTDQGEVVIAVDAVELRRESTALRFSVRDSGIGIPAEHVPGLFEPFTQVDASDTRRHGGLGLGLAISSRLVRVMGGALTVESTPGKGSAFSFELAFAPAEGAANPGPEADLQGLAVLVADDHASARLSLSAMLERLSCQATAVASGEEALSEAVRAAREGRPYAVALLDWRMPGLDGIATAARLASSAGPAPPPVPVLVTAYDVDEAIRGAEAAGISTVLRKPVSASTLHDTLREILHPGSARSPRAATAVHFAPGQEVLVVEDHPINREIARELLSRAGLGVSEAENGEQALARLRERRADAVLMDVQMPVLDGLGAVRRIRADPALATLPVIALTAHSMLGDRERFLEAGMSDYLAKPIEEGALLRILARWLRATGPAEGTQTESGPRGQPPSIRGFDVVGGLRRLGGNAQLYRRLVDGFRSELGAASTSLRRLLEGGSPEALERLHTLKGSAATLGALRIAQAAADLESVLRSSPASVPSLDELLAAVDEALAGDGPRPPSGTEELPLEPNVARAALPIAARLAEQLASSNLAATDSYAELLGVMGPRLVEPMRTLEASLDQLDFAAAANTLAAARRALERAAGEPR